MVAAIAKFTTMPMGSATAEPRRVRPSADLTAAAPVAKLAAAAAPVAVGYGGKGQAVYPIEFYKPADCPWTA